MVNRVLNTLRKRVAGLLRPSPLISVIIPVYNVSRYLDEALASVRSQTYSHLQIIVIDDGSTDDSAAIAARHANDDQRIELYSQTNRGLGATRNIGVGMARGTYLMFVDSDDRLKPDAIEHLAQAAEAYQADITVAPLIRFNSTRQWNPEWVRRLHSEPQKLASIEEFPPLLRNNYSVGRLFRRDFWTANAASFREGVAYEDQPLTTVLYIRARRIASIVEPTYEYRERDDKSSISQQTHTLTDLDARIAAWQATVDALKRENASEAVVTAWLQTIYGTHVHWYLDNEGTRSREYWTHLRDGILELDSAWQTEPREWASPARMVALDYLRADRQDEYVALRDAGLYDADRQSYRLDGDQLYWTANLPLAPELEPRHGLDWELLPLRAAILSARWDTAVEDLVIIGYHIAPKLDLSDVAVQHELVLHNPGAHKQAPIPTQPASDTVRFESRKSTANLVASAFEARIPASAFAASGDTHRTFRLLVTSHFNGLSRSQDLTLAPKWFSTKNCGPLLSADGLLISPVVDVERREFSILVSRPAAQLSLADSRVVVHPLDGCNPVTLVAGYDSTEIELVSGPTGKQMAEVNRLADLVPPRSDSKTAVSAKDSKGQVVRLAYTGEAGAIAGQHILEHDREGYVRLSAPASHCQLTQLGFIDNQVSVAVQCTYPEGWAFTNLSLRSRDNKVTARPLETTNDRFTARIPLELERVGLTTAALPEGGYDLVADFIDPSGTTHRTRVKAGREYIDQVPTLYYLGGSRWRTLVADRGEVHLDCRPDIQ